MREYVSTSDWRWVMVCDAEGCINREGPFPRQPDLGEMASRGWFIAELSGDRCPTCPRSPRIPAHKVMARIRRKVDRAVVLKIKDKAAKPDKVDS